MEDHFSLYAANITLVPKLDNNNIGNKNLQTSVLSEQRYTNPQQHINKHNQAAYKIITHLYQKWLNIMKTTNIIQLLKNEGEK